MCNPLFAPFGFFFGGPDIGKKYNFLETGGQVVFPVGSAGSLYRLLVFTQVPVHGTHVHKCPVYVGVYSQLHLLCIDRNSKRQRSHISAGNPTRDHALRLCYHPWQRGDDHTHTRFRRVSAHAEGKVRLACRDDDCDANCRDEHLLDAVAGRIKRSAECDERRRDPLLRYLLQRGTSWHYAGEHIRRDFGQRRTNRHAFFLGSRGCARNAVCVLCAV